MIDERPIRLAIEKVIAKHRLLFALERVKAIPQGHEHDGLRFVLNAEVEHAFFAFKVISHTHADDGDDEVFYPGIHPKAFKRRYH